LKKRIAIMAVPRKTRNPIVSVSAVTKMLEASAGSIRHFFNANGMVTPASAPMIWFKSIAEPATTPRIALCFHANAIRPIASASATPFAAPMSSSFRNARTASPSFTSPNARLRITTVNA
jgi:hypothetical protein